MKPNLLIFGAIAFSSLIALTVTRGWEPDDDDQLVQSVATAALGEDETFHRVTATTFKMENLVATLCDAPRNETRHDPHFSYYCHVHVNERALEPIRSGQGTYPEGSLIIKQKFSDERGINTELFTVMRKMPDGYDPDNGNWEYSIVDASASTVLSRGRTDSCIRCHADFAHTDFVTRLYMVDGKQ